MADFGVARLDRAGGVVWSRVTGDSLNDHVRNVVGTRDGGFVAAGVTDSLPSGLSRGWLVRLDAEGTP